VYAGRDAHFTLYEDEGTNYDYEKGAFSNIPFTYSEASGTLTIGARAGSFSNMLQKRVFRIVKISKGSPVQLDAVRTAGQVVRYKGNAETISLVGMRQ
jgi:alpha-D-xyloside xylohydrolase